LCSRSCFFKAPATPQLHPLSLHDALPISAVSTRRPSGLKAARWSSSACPFRTATALPVPASQTRAVWSSEAVATHWPSGLNTARSEEHTSELQSLTNLVCPLLLEKKNQTL